MCNYEEKWEPHLTVTVNIRLPEHFLDVPVGELFTQVTHDVSQLRSGDETVTVLVEHLGAAKISPHCGHRTTTLPPTDNPPPTCTLAVRP
jgi:hypothetical protein